MHAYSELTLTFIHFVVFRRCSEVVQQLLRLKALRNATETKWMTLLSKYDKLFEFNRSIDSAKKGANMRRIQRTLKSRKSLLQYDILGKRQLLATVAEFPMADEHIETVSADLISVELDEAETQRLSTKFHNFEAVDIPNLPSLESEFFVVAAQNAIENGWRLPSSEQTSGKSTIAMVESGRREVADQFSFALYLENVFPTERDKAVEARDEFRVRLREKPWIWNDIRNQQHMQSLENQVNELDQLKVTLEAGLVDFHQPNRIDEFFIAEKVDWSAPVNELFGTVGFQNPSVEAFESLYTSVTSKLRDQEAVNTKIRLIDSRWKSVNTTSLENDAKQLELAIKNLFQSYKFHFNEDVVSSFDEYGLAAWQSLPQPKHHLDRWVHNDLRFYFFRAKSAQHRFHEFNAAMNERNELELAKIELEQQIISELTDFESPTRFKTWLYQKLNNQRQEFYGAKNEIQRSLNHKYRFYYRAYKLSAYKSEFNWRMNRANQIWGQARADNLTLKKLLDAPIRHEHKMIEVKQQARQLAIHTWTTMRERIAQNEHLQRFVNGLSLAQNQMAYADQLAARISFDQIRAAELEDLENRFEAHSPYSDEIEILKSKLSFRNEYSRDEFFQRTRAAHPNVHTVNLYDMFRAKQNVGKSNRVIEREQHFQDYFNSYRHHNAVHDRDQLLNTATRMAEALTKLKLQSFADYSRFYRVHPLVNQYNMQEYRGRMNVLLDAENEYRAEIQSQIDYRLEERKELQSDVATFAKWLSQSTESRLADPQTRIYAEHEAHLINASQDPRKALKEEAQYLNDLEITNMSRIEADHQNRLENNSIELYDINSAKTKLRRLYLEGVSLMERRFDVNATPEGQKRINELHERQAEKFAAIQERVVHEIYRDQRAIDAANNAKLLVAVADTNGVRVDDLNESQLEVWNVVKQLGLSRVNLHVAIQASRHASPDKIGQIIQQAEMKAFDSSNQVVAGLDLVDEAFGNEFDDLSGRVSLEQRRSKIAEYRKMRFEESMRSKAARAILDHATTVSETDTGQPEVTTPIDLTDYRKEFASEVGNSREEMVSIISAAGIGTTIGTTGVEKVAFLNTVSELMRITKGRIDSLLSSGLFNQAQQILDLSDQISVIENLERVRPIRGDSWVNDKIAELVSIFRTDDQKAKLFKPDSASHEQLQSDKLIYIEAGTRLAGVISALAPALDGNYGDGVADAMSELQFATVELVVGQAVDKFVPHWVQDISNHYIQQWCLDKAHEQTKEAFSENNRFWWNAIIKGTWDDQLSDAWNLVKLETGRYIEESGFDLKDAWFKNQAYWTDQILQGALKETLNEAWEDINANWGSTK